MSIARAHLFIGVGFALMALPVWADTAAPAVSAADAAPGMTAEPPAQQPTTPPEPSEAAAAPAAAPATPALTPAYKATLNTLLPLSPADINDLRGRVDAVNKSSAISGPPPPRQTTRSIQVTTEPGVNPKAVCMRRGFGSSLVFLDATGEPWPITGYMVGDSTAYNITQPSIATANVLNISPKNTYGVSNITVSLKGNSVPVIIILTSKDNATQVDGVVSVMVAGRGPNAKAPVFGPTMAPATSLDMMSILDGVAPKSAIPLTVVGTSGSAWRMGDRLYIRTQTPIRSPASFAVVNGANNLRVYELPVVPVLLASEDGKTITVHIEGATGG